MAKKTSKVSPKVNIKKSKAKSSTTTATRTTDKESKTKSANVKAKYYAATGRRKSAVCKVRLMEGSGKIIVNQKDYKEYFPGEVWQSTVISPLVLTGRAKSLDVSIITRGGGVNSQAEAARHGISRALEKLDNELRSSLKKAGFLTRDPREKERKKYGLKRARRAPQFSKR